ncbi:TPA: hypothetical protein N0F65_005675 [Lagenidium giganteum]|uniref:Uncharacterized protein n=1 Tax=Lagenidium giganteum TaxID=4803 RepID=A0AAV2ZHX1_9STRA|nr:TPA: hypothetical protein N0F65_005675 [Lagenidium giganteum]
MAWRFVRAVAYAEATCGYQWVEDDRMNDAFRTTVSSAQDMRLLSQRKDARRSWPEHLLYLVAVGSVVNLSDDDQQKCGATRVARAEERAHGQVRRTKTGPSAASRRASSVRTIDGIYRQKPQAEDQYQLQTVWSSTLGLQVNAASRVMKQDCPKLKTKRNGGMKQVSFSLAVMDGAGEQCPT